ncbi:phospholipid-binding protein MlaC [Denitratisoma sp. DHT3]|uniref:MlaC/ttg2D family ABC transporter substrate-binding protein n=1 Tax=Denitratisoma sp. DHT3 TaxID=1981880 RepID=UPI001C95F628|nr:ABC transporter substrate-binding protein [Denitratisoma sp. DHT3]
MKWLLGLFAGMLIAGSVLADEVAPDALVRDVTTEVLDILRKDKDIQSGNTRKAIELVENKVLPYFNFQRMTAQAVGKSWRQATPAQQKALTDEFKTLLVRTYSNALTAYKTQTVDFKPLRAAPADTEVTVRTEIKQAGSKPITLNYVLEKTGGNWMVVDMVIADISQVISYRDQFRQEVATGGLDGLIKSLEAKNKSAEASVAKK